MIFNPFSFTFRYPIIPPPEGTILLNNHTFHYHNRALFIIGGGGNCFSFGTHYNSFLSLLIPPSSPSSSSFPSPINNPIPNLDTHNNDNNNDNNNIVNDYPIAKPFFSHNNNNNNNNDNNKKEVIEVEVIEMKGGDDDNEDEKKRRDEEWRKRYEEKSKERRPVVFRGNSFGTSVRKWREGEYLINKCGEKAVSVHVSPHSRLNFVNRNYKFEVMPFSHLIHHIFPSNHTIVANDNIIINDDDDDVNNDNTVNDNNNDNNNNNNNKMKEKYYLRSLGNNARRDTSDLEKAFPEIAGDFEMPSFISPLIRPLIFSSVLRVGSKDLQLWTHYDVMDNILCQITGVKEVILWHPHDIHRMYLHGSSSEIVDINNPSNDEVYPLFKRAQRYRCLLQPGDCLFIPSLWFHNITSFDPSISVNIFWKNLPGEYYEKKDLFGNKDFLPAASAMSAIDDAEKELLKLPPYYRDFYLRLIIQRLTSNLTSPF